MPFSSKLCLLFTTLLLSSLSASQNNAPGNVDVQYYADASCLGTASAAMTLTRGNTQSADKCYYIGTCVPSGAAFMSFVVSRIAVSLSNNNGAEAQCTVITYTDTACLNVISGVSAAGPLYVNTDYPTGCVNQLSGTTPVAAAAFKLVCGVTSQ